MLLVKVQEFERGRKKRPLEDFYVTDRFDSSQSELSRSQGRRKRPKKNE